MTSLHVSITDPLRDWVESRTKSGDYANNSDYVRDLIRKDKERSEKISALNTEIQKGIASGDGGVLDMHETKKLARRKLKVDC